VAAVLTFLPALAITIWGLDIWIALAASVFYTATLVLIRWPRPVTLPEASATASATRSSAEETLMPNAAPSPSPEPDGA
jgi:hypothetical protein